MPDLLKVTRSGSLTTVTLNRPDSHNALNAALIEELTRCFEELAEDEETRVVVLAGEGRSFCAGADIGYMRETAGLLLRGEPGGRKTTGHDVLDR